MQNNGNVTFSWAPPPLWRRPAHGPVLLSGTETVNSHSMYGEQGGATYLCYLHSCSFALNCIWVNCSLVSTWFRHKTLHYQTHLRTVWLIWRRLPCWKRTAWWPSSAAAAARPGRWLRRTRAVLKSFWQQTWRTLNETDRDAAGGLTTRVNRGRQVASNTPSAEEADWQTLPGQVGVGRGCLANQRTSPSRRRQQLQGCQQVTKPPLE